MPDFDTRPIRPRPAMLAGMMPALERPGEMIPGQFGPRMRVFPLRCAALKNSAVSRTGMPSVMHTTSGTSASMASMTAAFAYGAGTNTTLTFAPVSFTASCIESKTGTGSSSNRTD